MGKNYTSIESVIELIKNKQVLDKIGWEEIGREIGRVFYQLFYNIGDYDYPEIRINYPEEFDPFWE